MRVDRGTSKAGQLLKAAKHQAKVRGLPFDLTKEWLAERLATGVCEVTGLPVRVNGRFDRVGPRVALSASLDRVNPDLGYVQSNCRVVCWMYNAAKSQFSDEEVLALALALTSKSANPGLVVSRWEVK